MPWLNELLRHIVILVVLAAFLDLLLPKDGFQRYVKLVVSLFIILALLQPIVLIVRGDMQIIESIEQWLLPSNGRQHTEVEEVLRRGDELRERSLNQSQLAAEIRVSELLHEQLQARTNLSIESVTVELQRDGERTELRAVEVWATHAPKKIKNQNGGLLPVQEISIEIMGIDAGSSLPLVTEAEHSTTATEEEALRRWIHEAWNVPLSHIMVLVQPLDQQSTGWQR